MQHCLISTVSGFFVGFFVKYCDHAYRVLCIRWLSTCYCHVPSIGLLAGLLEPGSPAMDQLQRPSPTKRPRAPPDHVDDDDFLSRRALEVYNGAQRSGSHRMIAFTTRPETDLGPGEFDDLVEHFGPGSSYTLDCDDHDHLNDSSRCTYKCRSMVRADSQFILYYSLWTGLIFFIRKLVSLLCMCSDSWRTSALHEHAIV